MLQGAANAFITPLLVAGLAELVAPERFGRSLGIYSSFQGFGSVAGPVLGGVAADTDWRLAFVGTAAASAVLAMFPPRGEPRESVWPEIRALLTRPMLGWALEPSSAPLDHSGYQYSWAWQRATSST